MKIYFMLAFTRETLNPNPVLVELFETLRRQGHEVELGVANELVMDPGQFTAQHDLYILKSHTALWLSLAGILHSQGARILNPYSACLAAHDKIVAERLLEAAGIPTPHSWVTGDLGLLRPLCEERALVVKPYIGGRGRGVVIAHNPYELAAIPTPDQPLLAQEYIPGDEIKVAVIGQTVAAIRKIETPAGSIRVPCEVSSEVREIALKCGRVFGLGMYGLDVILGADGPVVIDLNYFPSYKGVPNAAALLARYILDNASAYAHSSFSAETRDASRSGVRRQAASYAFAQVG
ncbi:MAG TPA: ATP-grasp domain-containing protein [Ktedonobacterales bacterium]|jgi:ribosomal protein S6--L-glutamate ligase|nr:ATP-grasp domain-containing protein [Ktedonobacterales bacterium]